MIRRARLQGYKNHRDTEVELRPLTVLVGPNGAGKTSFLTGLQMLRGVPATSVERYLQTDQPLESLLHRGGNAIELRTEGVVVGDPWSVELALPLHSLARGQWTLGDQAPARFGKGIDVSLPEASPFAQQLRSIELFSFDPEKIALPAPLTQVVPKVDATGANTGPTLATLKLTDLAAFQRVEEALRQIVPGVEHLLVKPAPMRNAGIGYHVSFDFRGTPNVPAFAASGGTLVTLALLTALHAPDAPRVVLIDEIDHALHPKAQMALVKQLRALLARDPELQIIVTTHSPYILDAVDVDDVRVFATRADGSVAVKPLAQHPTAGRTKGTLSAGQLWSLDDESTWVAGA